MPHIDPNVSMKNLAMTYHGLKAKEIVKKGYINAQYHINGSKDFKNKSI